MSTAERVEQDAPAGEPLSRRTLSLFWQAANEFPVLLWIGLVAPFLITVITQFGGPYVISRILDQIQQGTASLSASMPLIGWFAATQILGDTIGWRISLYAAWTFEVRAQRRLNERIFSHLSMQSESFHANRFSGSLVSQTNKLVGAFETFWDTIIWQVIPVATSVVAAVAILMFYVPIYAVFLAVMSGLFTVLVVRSGRTMERLNVSEAQAATGMTGLLADVMTNIVTVKSHAAEAAELARARQAGDLWVDRSLTVMRGFMGYSTGFSLITALTNVGALVAAVAASESGTIGVATVYLAATYTLTVTRQLWEIPRVMRSFNKVLGDAHDMVEILGREAEVADATGAQLAPGPGSISVDDISFTHSGLGESVLFEHFTLHVGAGEKVGLVGHSGAGKSTLVRLLLRFADVDAGVISVDGQDIREVTGQSLRSAISYVSQEPLLFHRSIAENIAYGRPSASEAEIRQAAEKAFAHEFIERLPLGYATKVGERGVKLSGGQRQRIAIARAILKDSPILILDEATSALDSESERHIQQALAAAMGGRTTIVIAHRLSTIQAMDRIVVLESGRIVEQGSHRELLDRGGVYADMWQHQSGGFLDPGRNAT